MTPQLAFFDASRPLSRRTLLRSAFGLTAGGAALYLVGCGGGDDGEEGGGGTATAAGTPAASGTSQPSDIRPVMLTSEFVAGRENRFAVGLLRGNQLVKDADVHLRFFTVNPDGTSGVLKGEGDMQFVELNVDDAHAHDGTTGESAEVEGTAFYIGHVPFDSAGRWGVEMNVTPQGGGEPISVAVPFEVLAEPKTPAIGTQPPPSRNDTAETTTNPEGLCSRDPQCSLHDLVIADVLGQGRPLVVQFSTPAFCETRFCGPVLEVLLSEVPNYQDRVDFIHIEVWEDFQAKRYRRANQEWALPTEPYTFFMDAQGNVVEKLEAIFSEEELREALERLVQA